MKKSIKNLKINKKILGSFVLATSIFGLIISTKKETKVIPFETSLEQTLNENKDKTNLDEVLDLNEDISDKIRQISPDLKIIVPINSKNVDKEYLLNCVNKMELYMHLSSEINNLSFANKNNLNEIDEITRMELFKNKDNVEFVNDLIKKFNNENSTDIEKARCIQKLNYLDSYYQKYVMENGLVITEDLITKHLKSCGCSISGLEPLYYDSCSINTLPQKFLPDFIIVTDPISGDKYKYHIKNKSGVIKDLTDTLSDIEKFINNDDYNYTDVYDVCVPALNNVKNILKTGVKLDKDIVVLDIVNTNKNIKIKLRTKA